MVHRFAIIQNNDDFKNFFLNMVLILYNTNCKNILIINKEFIHNSFRIVNH